MVVDPATIKALPDLLYRAAGHIEQDDLNFGADIGDNPLVNDLRTMAILLDMIPDD